MPAPDPHGTVIMPKLLSDYATPLTTGLFLVSLISGVALFFHVGTAQFHAMHEWLSMVLVLPFVLHLWRNWRPFLSYLRRVPMALALGLSLVAALAFAVPTIGAGGGGSPQRAVFTAFQNGTLAQVAPLFGLTGEALAEALRQAGFAAAEAGATVAAIAAAEGKDAFAVIAAIAAAAPKTP